MNLSTLNSLRVFAPELVLGGSAIFLFLLAAIARRPSRWQRWVFPAAALTGLVATLATLLISVWLQNRPEAFGCLHRDNPCKLFSGMLATDPFGVFFQTLVLVATVLGVILSIGSPSLPKERRGEYHALLLVMALGMCLLVSANHLLMIYVAIETVSLISYLLTGWDNRRGRSAEAGLKYVLYGGVASGVMLFGMSLLYGLFGNLSIEGLRYAMLGSPALESGAGQWAVSLAVILILAGLGYKIAAVPFHMWCPDVYEGAPTPFTALLSVGPKAAGFALILRFFYGLFLVPGGASLQNMLRTSEQIPWLLVLGVISALTMTLGNLTAIVQNNLKRLLAYSSIAHAGYILMGVVAGGQEGFEAVAIYTAIYLLMNMGAFAVVSAIDRATGTEDISAFRGLGKKAPLLALVMAVFLFSLTGLPPTAGFVGKLYLFAALLKNGGTWFVALAVVGILNSLIAFYYYARVLKAMYLEPPGTAHTEGATGNLAAIVATALAVPTLLLGIFWQPLAIVASWSARLLH